MRNHHLATAAASLTVLSLASFSAYAYPGEQYADQATISMQQAKQKARIQVDGHIQSAVLEKEQGGSGLRYSFDIQSKSGLREIGIDAETGHVLENSVESQNAEMREREAEDNTGNDKPVQAN